MVRPSLPCISPNIDNTNHLTWRVFIINTLWHSIKRPKSLIRHFPASRPLPTNRLINIDYISLPSYLIRLNYRIRLTSILLNTPLKPPPNPPTISSNSTLYPIHIFNDSRSPISPFILPNVLGIKLLRLPLNLLRINSLNLSPSYLDRCSKHLRKSLSFVHLLYKDDLSPNNRVSQRYTIWTSILDNYIFRPTQFRPIHSQRYNVLIRPSLLINLRSFLSSLSPPFQLHTIPQSYPNINT